MRSIDKAKTSFSAGFEFLADQSLRIGPSKMIVLILRSELIRSESIRKNINEARLHYLCVHIIQKPPEFCNKISLPT